jgi:hypothetical protein
MRGWFLSVLTISFALGSGAAGTDVPKPLVQVATRTGPAVVGELVSENDATVTVLDMKTSRQKSFDKKDVLRVVHDLSDEDAIRETDLPTVVAWKVTKFSSSTPTTGRVAKISDAVVYLTLGSNAGLTSGQKLNVFHVVGDITDPITRKVIGRERSRIGQVQVTEVQDTYAKSKLLGDLEVKLASGDEVETMPLKVSVAVVPLLDVNGQETEGGISVAEDLTTALVARKVPVVERTILRNVLKELALQYTDLVDPATVQRLGKQIGASTVLTGKIVPDGSGRTKTHVRLINVETGEVLLAAAQASSAKASVASSSKPEAAPASSSSPSRAGSAAATGSRASSGSTGTVAHAPPKEDKIIGEDEHHGDATNHPSFTKGNQYTIKIDPKDPTVRIASSAIYFQASCPADRGFTQGNVLVSLDYGKNWVGVMKWDTAAFKAAKRRKGWFGVDLGPPFKKTPNTEVDEIQVRFDVDGQVEAIAIEKVIWARK